MKKRKNKYLEQDCFHSKGEFPISRICPGQLAGPH